MSKVEGHPTPIDSKYLNTMDLIDTDVFDTTTPPKLAMSLYYTLTLVLVGKASIEFTSYGEVNGLEAWRELCARYRLNQSQRQYGLLWHIMNTDFAYRGKFVHHVPEPYIWESSFRVFYDRLDNEHKALFDCIRDCEDHPDDGAKLAHCKTLLRMHFDYEEHEFCNTVDYDCYGHYIKHYNFQTKFQAADLPIPK